MNDRVRRRRSYGLDEGCEKMVDVGGTGLLRFGKWLCPLQGLGLANQRRAPLADCGRSDSRTQRFVEYQTGS